MIEFDVSRRDARIRIVESFGRVSTPLNDVESSVPAAFKVARVSREITLEKLVPPLARFSSRPRRKPRIEESFSNRANKRSSNPRRSGSCSDTHNIGRGRSLKANIRERENNEICHLFSRDPLFIFFRPISRSYR